MVAQGILLPFLGTSLGSACVFFVRKQLDRTVCRALTGFTAGVMTAASVWSLLIPAIEESEKMGSWAFVPAAAGFWIGVIFLLLLDRLILRLQSKDAQEEDRQGRSHRTAMLLLAVILHNIPEGMVVGAVYAGLLAGSTAISAADALAVSLGIAVQNLPEGAIIALPLRAKGKGRMHAFGAGVLSGVVEPIGGAITVLATVLVVPVLPYLLSFAAGAMVYVVVKELIPEASADTRTDLGVLSFALGFTLMMAMDVALG